MPRRTNYQIYGTGTTPKEAMTNYDSVKAIVNDKLAKAKAKPLEAPTATLFSVKAQAIDLPKEIKGNLESTVESAEGFQICEANAREIIKFDVNFTDYKVQSTYAITAKQKNTLHPPKKSSKPSGRFDAPYSNLTTKLSL